MPNSKESLEKVAALACIKIDNTATDKLANDVASIMEFVEQLCNVDTKNVAPLYHPLDIYQRLRQDNCIEVNQVDKLAQIAPLFEDGHYLVPKVISTGK
jgi:aspartyl-tRNA(Asn)/glutamyl-tRNA(Gln) amidotransferase subunit C